MKLDILVPVRYVDDTHSSKRRLVLLGMFCCSSVAALACSVAALLACSVAALACTVVDCS
jgi:hypothetical protein